ncbi:hypothetical protein [Streptomyces plumbiresistens]|uniref:hypothetical protein n=1 Tax=Streptomyces plumbiresistens TaxID=511811 RepID=UPI003CD074AC
MSRAEVTDLLERPLHESPLVFELRPFQILTLRLRPARGAVTSRRRRGPPARPPCGRAAPVRGGRAVSRACSPP